MCEEREKGLSTSTESLGEAHLKPRRRDLCATLGGLEHRERGEELSSASALTWVFQTRGLLSLSHLLQVF